MPEVLAQVARREALHELRRLPQLDLEDDGQIAIAAQPLEVQTGDAAQALARVGRADERRAPFGDGVLHRAFEDRDEQVVLAAEVEIDGAGGDAGGLGHVGDLGVEEAALREHTGGGAHDGVALVADRRPGLVRRGGTAGETGHAS